MHQFVLPFAALCVVLLSPQHVNAAPWDRIVTSEAEEIAAIKGQTETRAKLSAAAFTLLSNPVVVTKCEGRAANYGFMRYLLPGTEASRHLKYSALGFAPRQIATVFDGSPAATAGLQSGDVVVHINGERLKDSWKGDNEFTEVLADAREDGDRLELEVERDVQSIKLSIPPTSACDYEVFVMNKFGVAGDGSFPVEQVRALVVDKVLIDQAQSERELTAIVAHEVSHHLAGHVAARRKKGRAGRFFDSALGVAGVNTAGVGEMAGRFAFKPEEEIEADRLAQEMLAATGDDGTAYVDFIRRLGSIDGDAVATVLGSHPIDDARLAALPNPGH